MNYRFGSLMVNALYVGTAKIWPTGAAPHPFPLTTPPADMVGFTLDAATDRTATFTKNNSARSHITWPLQFPVGARVRFDWSSENPVHCRTNSTSLQDTTAVMRIISGLSGSGSVDVIITEAAPYFGFIVTSNFPNLPVHVTNFTVDLP